MLTLIRTLMTDAQGIITVYASRNSVEFGVGGPSFALYGVLCGEERVFSTGTWDERKDPEYSRVHIAMSGKHESVRFYKLLWFGPELSLKVGGEYLFCGHINSRWPTKDTISLVICDVIGVPKERERHIDKSIRLPADFQESARTHRQIPLPF